LDLASQVGHPASHIYTAVFAGLLTNDMRDDARFDRVIDAIARLPLHGVWADVADILRLRRAVNDGGEGAAATIEKIVDAADGKQQRVFNNEARCLAAQGYLALDDPASAQRVVARGMAEAIASGSIYAIPELRRLNALASADEHAPSAEVDALFRAAVEAARANGAMSPLLRATTSWAAWALTTQDDATVAVAERSRSEVTAWFVASSVDDV
jgi:hypothetical protein